MREHIFGGDWTIDKLDRISKYLGAYTTIFRRNPRASYYTTYFVDAFAGTGERSDSSNRPSKDSFLFEVEEDEDRASLTKGSAKVALDIDPAFDRYLFIEHKKSRVAELEKLKEIYPKHAVSMQIEQGDANTILVTWCKATDWNQCRAVVFLDPYGMQVNWATIAEIASTKAIDLWMLFPIGVGVNRLLMNRTPPPKHWADALTRIFGEDGWREKFYKKSIQKSLFGDEVLEQKVADFSDIQEYFLDRLRTVFEKVAPNPLILANSKGVPLYLLCFAAGNAKGAPTAVKIAQEILRN
jgi:three-Cys-motif partner protein